MTIHPRGRCRVCRRKMSVRLDGTLAYHGATTIYDAPCVGSREWPVHGSVSGGPRSELVHRSGYEAVTVPRSCLDVALVGASVRAWLTWGC